MARTFDSTFVNLEKAKAALVNARKRNEVLRLENAALRAELEATNKYTQYSVDIPEQELLNKYKALESTCKYGLSHFCDGSVNWSVAPEGTKPFPPCMWKAECNIRKHKLT